MMPVRRFSPRQHWLAGRVRREETAASASSTELTEELTEVFARAALTAVAEPGDGIMGALVLACGAPAVLTALLGDISVSELAAHAAAAGLSTEQLPAAAIHAARERWRSRVNQQTLEACFEHAALVGVSVIIPTDAYWPSGLNDLGPHAPLALWCRGNHDAVAALRQSISLVGARAATGYGESVTADAAAGLVSRGFGVLSGAAYGIDGMAHRSTLATGGVTVAFLAGGTDRFYPAGHDQLLAEIVRTGAVLSELPCGYTPTRWRFLQRNRLIAAASQATVVLEAGYRSGSLNTAGHAATLGRPLGAVPGPVTSPASAGCHRLLREYDAVCVTTAAEMAELHPDWVAVSDKPATESSLRSSTEVRVLDALSTKRARTTGEIARDSGLSPAAVRAALGALDLEGLLCATGEGWLKLRGREAAQSGVAGAREIT